MANTSRQIISNYFQTFRSPVVVRSTRARHPDRAILHAVKHILSNDYKAGACEVWDDSDGSLIATITRSASGAVKVTSFLVEG